MAGVLYIVATPIGNLEDITLRAMRTLMEVDVVLAEDTRVTKKLTDFIISRNSLPTNHYPQLLSYHQHSSDERKLEILKMLMDGNSIALVTDAGTPGISDPGNELIQFLLAQMPDLKIVPIPGTSAITAALSVSGFDSSKFLFLGFWPKKKAAKVLGLIKELKLNTVYYDSPFRVIKNLETIKKELGSNIRIVVARELTKIYETVYRGDIGEVIEVLRQKPVKGEIVVILNIDTKDS